jgi:hypothetical protein
VALPVYLLRPLAPGIGDPDPVVDIDITVLAEGLAFCREDLILRDIFAAFLAPYAIRHSIHLVPLYRLIGKDILLPDGGQKTFCLPESRT